MSEDAPSETSFLFLASTMLMWLMFVVDTSLPSVQCFLHCAPSAFLVSWTGTTVCFCILLLLDCSLTHCLVPMRQSDTLRLQLPLPYNSSHHPTGLHVHPLYLHLSTCNRPRSVRDPQCPQQWASVGRLLLVMTLNTAARFLRLVSVLLKYPSQSRSVFLSW